MEGLTEVVTFKMDYGKMRKHWRNHLALKLRALDDDPELFNPNMLKWLPAMQLCNIHELDTLMIKRLVELNQPLTYELYQNNDSTLVKKFILSAKQLKDRAKGSGMF